MNYRAKAVLETMISVGEFKTEPGVPSNARSTSLHTQMGALVTAMETHGADQVSGGGNAHSGVALRRELARQLREKCRDITVTASGLDTVAYPGADALFRMPRSQTYQALLATARAFLEDIGPMKAGFVESGMPADFDEKMADLIEELAGATNKKNGGRSEQVSGTAGLDAKAREGVRLLGQLDSVMQNLLKGNPSMLAAWESASHIQRPPKRAKETPPPIPGPTPPGSGSPPLAMAAPLGPGSASSAAPALSSPAA